MTVLAWLQAFCPEIAPVGAGTLVATGIWIGLAPLVVGVCTTYAKSPLAGPAADAETATPPPVTVTPVAAIAEPTEKGETVIS